MVIAPYDRVNQKGEMSKESSLYPFPSGSKILQHPTLISNEQSSTTMSARPPLWLLIAVQSASVVGDSFGQVKDADMSEDHPLNFVWQANRCLTRTICAEGEQG